MTPITDPEAYAAAAIQVLVPHFPDLADPGTAEVVAELIAHHAGHPHIPFEVVVDNPISAKWRLHADNRDSTRVLLFIHRVRYSEADAGLCRAVNDALRVLEA